MWRITLCIWLLVFSAAPGAAHADQHDLRLDRLFERLRTATDPADAATVEQQIWQIWFESGNPLVGDLLRSGMTAMTQRDYPLALKRFDQLVGEAPDFAEGWNKRATVHYRMDNLAASVHDIERTLSLEPRHFGALTCLGIVYERLGEPAAALHSFEAALAINPHLEQAQRRAEHLRNQRAGERT